QRDLTADRHRAARTDDADAAAAVAADVAGECARAAGEAGDVDRTLAGRILRDRAGVVHRRRAGADGERVAARVGDRGSRGEAERAARSRDDVDAGVAAVEGGGAVEVHRAVGVVEVDVALSVPVWNVIVPLP